ncbi:heterochromatin protein 1-like [Malaya genurostris]|uniref:heterochromatin protein 1-like n=1 Tax=Malaya genurostris TaxID=325434 RepID=UPI0026F3FA3F|nr:heterochromatin protein 1-like [Malaya genurostris]
MRKENLKRKNAENGDNEAREASPADHEEKEGNDREVENESGKENGDSKKASVSDDDFEDAETGDKAENGDDTKGENGKDADEEEDDKDEDEESEPLVKKSKKEAGGKKEKKAAKAAKKPAKAKAGKKAKEVVQKEEEGDDEKEDEEYEVQDIVDHRKERGGKMVYRIRWKNFGKDDDTWESEDTLSCPDIIKKYKAKLEKEEAASANKAKKGPGPKKGAKKETPKKPAKAAKDDDNDQDDEEEDDGTEYEVEKIIDVHFKRDGTREYLVRWKGFTSKDDTWEPADNLNCPHLIEKLNEKIDKSKSVSVKELRVTRKPTERLSLALGGRKTSRRNAAKIRVTYYDGE